MGYNKSIVEGKKSYSFDTTSVIIYKKIFVIIAI